MRLLVAFTLFTFLTTLATEAAPVPKVKPKTTTEKLHGKWKLVKSPGLDSDNNAIVVFGKDGSLTLTITTNDGAKFEVAGKFTADGDKIPYELETDNGVRKETLTIKKLTDDELVTVDPEDKVEEFQRVK